MTEATEAVALEFQAPTGETLRFAWHADELAALAPNELGERPLWRLGGELDWDEIDAVRLLSARLGDGRVLALAAIRPAGTDGHGEELIASAIGTAEAFTQLEETLLSTEQGADGVPRRVGLELYPPDGQMALRVAGDAVEARAFDEGGVHRTAIGLELRSADGDGAAILDLLTRR